MTLLIASIGPVKVTKERVPKEYYRDNPQGVEEEVSIKADEIEPVDPVVTEEVKEPNCQPLKQEFNIPPRAELLP